MLLFVITTATCSFLVLLAKLLGHHSISIPILIAVFMWFIFAPAEFFINASYYPTWEFYFVLTSGLFMVVLGSILNGPHATRLPKFDRLSICGSKPLLVILYIILLISILALCYRIAIGGLSFYKFSSIINTGDEGTFAAIISIFKKIRIYLMALVIGPAIYQSSKSRNLFLLSVLFLGIEVLIGYSGRSVLAQLPCVLFLIYIANVRKIPYQSIVIFASVFVSLFFILHYVRQRERWIDERVPISEFAQTIGSGGEWNPVAHTSELVSREHQVIDFPQMASRLYDELFLFTVNWIPRDLWKGKPETDFSDRMSSSYYGRHYREKDWVRNFTMFSQLYYSGWIFGVIAGSLIFGYFTTKFLYAISTYQPLYGAYFFGCFAMIIKIRNSLTTSLFSLISIAIVVYIMYLFSKMMIGFKYKKAD